MKINALYSNNIKNRYSLNKNNFSQTNFNLKNNTMPVCDTIVFSKKIKSGKKVDKNTEKFIDEQMSKIKKDTQEKYSQALDIYGRFMKKLEDYNSETQNDNSNTKIYKKPNTNSLIIELESDDKSSTTQCEVWNGKIIAISEGIEKLSDGEEITSKYYTFNTDGTLHSYCENFKTYPDGSVDIDKDYIYSNQGITDCWLNLHINPNFSATADKICGFILGEPDYYKQGCKFKTAGSQDNDISYKKTDKGWITSAK